MRVASLRLQDWRNYASADVTLAPGINAVVGRNAQGKTNLLEAIAFLTGLGSPRSSEAVLVREGADQALIHAEIVTGDRTVETDVEVRGTKARVLVNKVPVDGPRALTELFVAVFFGPDELALVKAGPENRRRFLDELAVKTRPSRHGIRREFERTLRQRNALLRSAPPRMDGSALATLDVWDEAFARAAGKLVSARLSILAEIAPLAAKRYEAIAGGGRMDLAYESSWLPEGAASEAEITQALASELATLRPRELERRVTLAGPQRDDLSVFLLGASGSMAARAYASQGDQRTAALALKLAERDLIADVIGRPPALLLDDVFSELDPARRGWLADAVRAGGQTLISSADALGAEAIQPERVIEVTDGRARIAV